MSEGFLTSDPALSDDAGEALDFLVGEDVVLVGAAGGELGDDRALVARLEPVQNVRCDVYPA